MAKEVVLTPIAVSDLDSVVDYLTNKWGLIVTNNFIERFEKVTILLSENPKMFPFFNEPKHLQKCIVTKHNILYFIETDDKITIITIFDTRQDPEKLSAII